MGRGDSGARDPAPGGQGGSARAPQPADTFFESTHPEMQRKHIPRVNEYQTFYIKHQPDTVLVDA